MSAPNVTVGVEPTENGALVFLPLAAKKVGASPAAQLALKLSITNSSASALHLNQVRLDFIGTPAVAAKTMAADVDIPANGKAAFFNAAADNAILPFPAPPSAKLSLFFDGFDQPATLTRPLAAHTSPVVGGSYRFPSRAADLRLGEYWSGHGASHAAAGDGSQLFAYDIGVVGIDPVSKTWSGLLPGTNGSKNEHYRVWGKPIYAMAAGTVAAFRDGDPTNPEPPADLSPPGPVEGNHFYLQAGDELVLYAHLQAGTLNPKLTNLGAAVKAGDFLGLAGNSGNSSAPHLHIHVIQATKPWGGPLRPLPFREVHVVERGALASADPTGPWVKVEDRGLPNIPTVIWPEGTAPTWYPPGQAEVAHHGIPAESYQTLFTKVTSSGYRPVWVDGYDVNGKTFFNVIFRPTNGVASAARHGLTAAQYQAEFDARTAAGFRPLHVESYLSGGEIRYATIFVKSPGPTWSAYHGRTAAAHQQRFDQLTADGFRPVVISVVSVGGQRSYTALYEKKNVGGFFAKSFLTPAEYQDAFNQNAQAGRRLVYLNAYTHADSPRLTAIWQTEAANSLVARHGMSGAQYQAEFDAQLAGGRTTRAVTGYEQGNSATFAAFWAQ